MMMEEFLYARLNEELEMLNLAYEKEVIGRALWDKLTAIVSSHISFMQWHTMMPVLTETAPEFDIDDTNFAYKITQYVEWMTRKRYIEVFGTDAPATGFLIHLLKKYEDHPEFQPEWLSI